MDGKKERKKASNHKEIVLGTGAVGLMPYMPICVDEEPDLF